MWQFASDHPIVFLSALFMVCMACVDISRNLFRRRQ